MGRGRQGEERQKADRSRGPRAPLQRAEDDEHENGEIWAVTLWDIFRKLGRDVSDRIIIESHFQLDPYTTFARGARAIMDADENLYGGAHVRKLKNIFNKRKINWQE